MADQEEYINTALFVGVNVHFVQCSWGEGKVGGRGDGRYGRWEKGGGRKEDGVEEMGES